MGLFWSQAWGNCRNSASVVPPENMEATKARNRQTEIVGVFLVSLEISNGSIVI